MSIEQNTKILASDVVNSLSEKAPTSHASNDITYGVGTDTDYGHVKLSDSVSTLDSLSGTAVSPKAVDDGLSSLFDDIITAAENAANTTTVPDNVAVELSNRIDEVMTIAEENKSAIDTKLDITGGMMTGELKFAGRNASGYNITAYNEDLYQGLAINSNSTEHGRGATLALRNADTTNQDPGSFVLAARDPSTSVSLRGFVDGTLSWNGKNIVRSINSVSADAAGNVDLIYMNGASSGSLKLPSGGTWRYRISAKTSNGILYTDGINTAAGGTTIWTEGGSTTSAVVVAVKTA